MVQVDEKRSGGAMSLTRRELVGGAVGAAVLLALGGTCKAFASSGNALLRPPGAQDEDRLLSLCLRCDRCRSACPHGAIDVAHIEDGLMSARTPKMNFHLGYCDYCGGDFKCVQVCPTLAISPAFDVRRNRIGVARIDHDECLLERLTGGCSKQCIDACEYGALSLGSDGKVHVDEASCNGCGKCEYVCPSSSYATYVGSGKRGINVEVVEGSEPA